MATNVKSKPRNRRLHKAHGKTSKPRPQNQKVSQQDFEKLLLEVARLSDISHRTSAPPDTLSESEAFTLRRRFLDPTYVKSFDADENVQSPGFPKIGLRPAPIWETVHSISAISVLTHEVATSGGLMTLFAQAGEVTLVGIVAYAFACLVSTTVAARWLMVAIFLMITRVVQAIRRR